MVMSFKRFSLGSGLVLALFASGTVAFSETLVGSTVESRIVLGFKVDDVAISGMLPDGWISVTLPNGPVAGSNLVVALIDRHLILDAEGKVEDPSSGPTVAFMAYGRTDGVEGVRGFVTRVYEEPPIVDPYGNSMPADIERVAGYTDRGGGDRVQSEIWTILPDTGGELRLELNFKVGGVMWSTGGESRPYSSVDPEFFRIYRYDQLAGLAMNSVAGRELAGNVSFKASDPEFVPLFDGSESLVSIVSIPVYIRKISLP